MTSQVFSIDPAVMAVGRLLWVRSAPHLSIAKAEELWGWMAPVQRKPWLDLAAELIAVIDKARRG